MRACISHVIFIVSVLAICYTHGCMLYTDLLYTCSKAHLPSLSTAFTEILQLESRARSSAKRGGLAAFLASCPENAFQKVLFLA